MKFSMFEPGVSGFIQFKDSYSITNSESIKLDGSTILKIVAQDNLDTTFTRKFNIIDVNVDDSNPRVKTVFLKFIDQIVYKLSNTFLSMSCTGTIPETFINCANAENVRLGRFLGDEGIMCAVMNGGESGNVCVPGNMSLLDFFIKYGRYQNIRMYQTYDKFFFWEFALENAWEYDNKYSDDTKNQFYAFKIHDYQIKNSSKLSTTLQLPQTVYYRFSGKSIDVETYNLSDYVSSLVMNNSNFNVEFQDTTGMQADVGYTPIGAQKYDLFNKYMCNNQLVCAMKGNFAYTFPGVKAEVEICPKSYSSVNQYAGDPVLNGYYLVTDVIYKFIRGYFIMKVTFSRFDNPDPTRS